MIPKRDPVKVAYVDDHDVVRRGVCELLNALGSCFVVIEADRGKTLLEKLEKERDPIDVCILDIFMPDMNGFDTLIEIRKRWPEMRVLILTGHNTEYYLIKMIMLGANGYLLKNCSPKELETAILSIHQNGIYHSEIMTSKFFNSVMRKEVKLPRFTDNEMEVLRYCCTDMSYAQIAQKLGVTPKSVDWYRESLFQKLNVKSRSGLVVYAIKFGIVDLQVDTTGTTISQMPK